MRATKLVPLADAVSAPEFAVIAEVYAEARGVLGVPHQGAVVYDPANPAAGATFRLGGAPPPAEHVLLWVLRCFCCDGLFTPAERERRPGSRLMFCSDRCRVRSQRGHFATGTPATCAGCGAPLDGGTRLSRRHCSPACRQRAYRKRHGGP